MSRATDWGENFYLDRVYGAGTPATWYVALLLSEPGEGVTGATLPEPTGGAYARVAVTNNATNWPAATNGRKTNGVGIQWPTATADWGNVRAFAIADAATGGNVVQWGPLTTMRNVKSGRTMRIPAGSLTITAD